MTIRVIKMLIKSLYQNIQDLPDDIKTKIYKEYFEPKIKGRRLTVMLYKCNMSSSGYKTQVLFIKIIKEALNNEELCKYLVKTNKGFGHIYNMYLNNTIEFPLITDIYQKFAVAWILYTFH